ncbi:alpha-tocopherol transfer protein-like [Eupeodes corollae]|uniref:alpha-tocopherol transfer protein-like n=1 Tax=Eupeodes corollae TaxID=290404 RepID=UPI0024938481|nr:alpha-tocopherol transfer protein-like [Eupeodes corollae]
MAQLRPLIPKLQERAISELNEVPERLQDDIQALRDWIEKQPHLRSRTSDQFLVAFLRGCKFNTEKAKHKLDKYYTLQAGIPEVFNNRFVDDQILLDIIRMGVMLRLPRLEGDEGPCINLVRTTIYDTDKYKFADVIRLGVMFGEIVMLEDDNAVINGYVEVMDMQDVGANHLFQLHPSLLRKLSVFADEASPMRQRGTHFINVPPPFEAGFRGIKSFFPEKATKRIHLHATGTETLHEHIPKKYLPVEYGGENGSIPEIIASMEKLFFSYRDYFKENVNFGVSEELRKSEKAIDYNSIFGIDGSFKKLTID